jgi:hypothetical protein
MSRSVARNVSLLLMLAAFPLISVGTTGGRPAVWWLGLASLAAGALIPPAMRFVPQEEKREETAEEKGAKARQHPTDLGDSSRVC